LLQRHLGAGFSVESAGVSEELAGRPANSRSVSCMGERGIDLTGHVSRWIGDLDLATYRWIVCVGSDEAASVRSALPPDTVTVLIANEAGGGIPDPYELGLNGYRDCVALLDQVMPEVARQISDATPLSSSG
jgi:protein-tyrosine-phosphatase